MAEKIKGPRVHFTIVILVSDHIVKLPFKYYICTHRPEPPSALVREASFFQRAVVNSDIHNQSV